MSSPHQASLGTPLSHLPDRMPATITQVVSPPHSPDWAARLAEIGFLPGEEVRVMSRTLLGGDPLVIRIGDSTFALRKAEADCVLVQSSPSVKDAA